MGEEHEVGGCRFWSRKTVAFGWEICLYEGEELLAVFDRCDLVRRVVAHLEQILLEV